MPDIDLHIDFHLKTARIRVRESLLELDLEETVSADHLVTVAPAVERFPDQRIGDPTPFEEGTPERALYMSAIGPTLDVPVAEQPALARRIAGMLLVEANERRAMAPHVKDATASMAKWVVAGRMPSIDGTTRIRTAVLDAAIASVEAMPDGHGRANAAARLMGVVMRHAHDVDAASRMFGERSIRPVTELCERVGVAAVSRAMTPHERGLLFVDVI